MGQKLLILGLGQSGAPGYGWYLGEFPLAKSNNIITLKISKLKQSTTELLIFLATLASREDPLLSIR